MKKMDTQFQTPGLNDAKDPNDAHKEHTERRNPASNH
jgi:hypothetical protein